MKHRPRRRPRLKVLTITKLIPNMLTTLAMGAGLIAIQFGLQQNWHMAVAFIAVAAMLDALDGGVARFLNAGSDFGAELDSLSDLISFGAAPAIILYVWCMGNGSEIASALVVLYTVCCALRLARFNIHLDDTDRPPWSARFFTGVPAPAAAMMVLLPMILSFELGDRLLKSPLLNGAVLLAVSLLMIGRLPSYSVKSLKVPQKLVLPVLLLVVVVAAFVVTRPWMTLSLVIAAYIGSLPFSMTAYRRLEHRAATGTSDEVLGELISEAAENEESEG